MITADKVRHSGAVTVSSMVRGEGMEWRLSLTYYGYGVREARALFKEYIQTNGYRIVKD